MTIPQISLTPAAQEWLEQTAARVESEEFVKESWDFEKRTITVFMSDGTVKTLPISEEYLKCCEESVASRTT